MSLGDDASHGVFVHSSHLTALAARHRFANDYFSTARREVIPHSIHSPEGSILLFVLLCIPLKSPRHLRVIGVYGSAMPFSQMQIHVLSPLLGLRKVR